ncbi:uncharacterized protein LOC126753528 [Bactrocera neohumeralis]|uniref:uncharacterized protein LOC126753528 n=1 Tax=Bactrocera neohumeralis TaxID=98809 RepID=UPI0021666431|nr:uncharacterized protein LOC126753528 [Bactrocera neohumeralis]
MRLAVHFALLLLILALVSKCVAINCQPCKIQEARRKHAEDMQRNEERVGSSTELPIMHI